MNDDALRKLTIVELGYDKYLEEIGMDCTQYELVEFMLDELRLYLPEAQVDQYIVRLVDSEKDVDTTDWELHPEIVTIFEWLHSEGKWVNDFNQFIFNNDLVKECSELEYNLL